MSDCTKELFRRLSKFPTHKTLNNTQHKTLNNTQQFRFTVHFTLSITLSRLQFRCSNSTSNFKHLIQFSNLPSKFNQRIFDSHPSQFYFHSPFQFEFTISAYSINFRAALLSPISNIKVHALFNSRRRNQLTFQPRIPA
jgi:hypothetical protein